MNDSWTATWASMTAPPRDWWVDAASGFDDQTVRQMLFTTAGGNAVRIRVSNRHGISPLRVGSAAIGVARRSNAADLIKETARVVTFHGDRHVVIPGGGEVLSDPVPFELLAHQVVAVDLYLPQRTAAPEHSLNPIQAAYAAAGNRAGNEMGSEFSERVTVSYLQPGADAEYSSNPVSCYLVGLEVKSTEAPGCIVIAGDSLTFGRWPQWLSRRLHAHLGTRAPAVVHVATSGIKLSAESNSSQSLATRFEADVLSVCGVAAIITSIGFNDLAIPSPTEFDRMFAGDLSVGAPDEMSTEAMIGSYQQIIEKAHQRSVPIFGCTIPPGMGGIYNAASFAVGSDEPPLQIELWPKKNERIRHEVNSWILKEANFNGVFDMASMLANRLDPAVKDPLYSGDGVHFDVGAWWEMAHAIDLDELISQMLCDPTGGGA